MRGVNDDELVALVAEAYLTVPGGDGVDGVTGGVLTGQDSGVEGDGWA